MPVAAGPAGLLIIGFQAAGHVVVDDEADVGLVDAHAEGQRGHDDLDASRHEGVLRIAALVGRQAGVIDARGPTGPLRRPRRPLLPVRLRVAA